MSILTRTRLFAKTVVRYLGSKGILYLVFLFFTYALPMLIINDKYLLVSSGTTETRLTVIAYWVLLIMYVIFRKYIWGRALILRPGFFKWVYSTLNRLLPLAMISVFLIVVVTHASATETIIRHIGISVSVGALFELMYFLKLKGEENE